MTVLDDYFGTAITVVNFSILGFTKLENDSDRRLIYAAGHECFVCLLYFISFPLKRMKK